MKNEQRISGVAVTGQIAQHLQCNRQRRRLGLLTTAAVLTLSSAPALAAPPLVINSLTNSTSPGGGPAVVGSGVNKRAIWLNGGSVGGQTVDIVATIVKSSAGLNHTFETFLNRPGINSVGLDDIQIEWRLYQAGTHNITTNTGGVPVLADAHVQFNDVDGPNLEKLYVQVCSGDVKWIRIDADATTGRAFGTVSGTVDTFTLVGDKNYTSQPESGLEVLYPNTSRFEMGRSAVSGYRIQLNNPSYSAFDTLDYECADFRPPRCC